MAIAVNFASIFSKIQNELIYDPLYHTYYTLIMSWRRLPLRPILAGITSTAIVSYVAYKYGRYEVLTNPPLHLFPKSSTTKLTSLEPPKYCQNISRVIPEIEKLGIDVVNSKPEIDHHTGNEFTTHKPLENEVPLYVVYPKTTEEVSQVLKICNRELVPVVPFSGERVLKAISIQHEEELL